MKLLKVLSASAVAAAVASTLVVAAGAEKAGLGFQTANWLFRNNLEQSKIMFATQTPKKVAARL